MDILLVVVNDLLRALVGEGLVLILLELDGTLWRVLKVLVTVEKRIEEVGCWLTQDQDHLTLLGSESKVMQDVLLRALDGSSRYDIGLWVLVLNLSAKAITNLDISTVEGH